MAVAATDVNRRAGEQAGLAGDGGEKPAGVRPGVHHGRKQPAVEPEGSEQLIGPDCGGARRRGGSSPPRTAR